MFVWDVGFCFAVDAVAFVALYEVEVFYDLSFIYVGVWVFLVVVFEVCGCVAGSFKLFYVLAFMLACRVLACGG